jgi:hypothetical protein
MIKYLVSGMILCMPGSFMASGQARIDKEIVVIKPYQPTLSDAFKINILPEVRDTLVIKPGFNYVTRPEKCETGFNIKPIKAATLVGQPLDKLYKTYLKLGMGNYITPLAELEISSLRSKEYSYGISLKHQSINGKIKLRDDMKIKPGYNDNTLRLFGNRFWDRSRLSGELQAGYKGINYYGINTGLEVFPDYDDIKQNYVRAGGEVRFESLQNDIHDFTYKTVASYSFLQDKFSNYQHEINVKAEFRKFIKGQDFGLDAGWQQFINSPSVDSSGLGIITLRPSISKHTDEYNYLIGAVLAGEVDNTGLNLHIYPSARLQINVVDGILMPYIGVDGKLQENSFSTLAEENPYIRPGMNIKSTSYKFIFYGGLTGSITTKLSYDINASYSLADDMYFFINDTAASLGNQFITETDDGEVMHLYGELSYRPSEKLWFFLKQDLYRYNLLTLEHPWHKPLYDLTFSVRYNLRDKILADVDIYYVGDMYARNYDPAAAPYLLDGTLDMNLGLEYRYTKALSVFLRLNHLLGSEELLYYQYPTMRFNLMAGFSYSL